MSERGLFTTSAILGFVAVALGAFGAHALKARFASLDDGAQRAAWWATASQYHMAHALALAVAGYLAARGAPWAGTSGVAFVCGVVLFSGSLYVMAVTGARWLGAITPVGGLCLLVGWGVLAVAASRLVR